MSTTISLRDLSDDPNAEAVIPVVLPWIQDSSAPYLDWLIGPDRAAQHLERSMHRPSSEVAIGRVVLADLEGAPIGGYVAIDGRSLSACRIADAIAALTEAQGGAGALRARMETSKHLFSPVPADAFYLSKLGVLVPHRGKGFARGLLARFLEHGRTVGFHRFRLDVHSGNGRAIELYRRAGFEVVSEATVPGTTLDYRAMELRW